MSNDRNDPRLSNLDLLLYHLSWSNVDPLAGKMSDFEAKLQAVREWAEGPAGAEVLGITDVDFAFDVALRDLGDLDQAMIAKALKRLKLNRGDRVEVKVEVTFDESVSGPPWLPEFCLSLLMSKASGEAAIGDLSERFELDRERFGAARARRMYWGRATRSLWPLIGRAAARAIKWSVVAEAVRRYFIGG